MRQTVSDFVWRRLADWGVERVYGYPGDGIGGMTQRGSVSNLPPGGGPPNDVIRRSRVENGTVWPRLLPAILGVWLFLSAFAWPHGKAQTTNMFVCGVSAIVISAVSMRYPPARYLNALLGVWVFFSAFALRSYAIATPWNELLVGIVIVAASLVPTRGARVRWPG